jgi:hypothetical protein
VIQKVSIVALFSWELNHSKVLLLLSFQSGHVFFLEEIATQIELYSDILKDTSLIKFLRYDVEDQLFQYIGGLEQDFTEEATSSGESESKVMENITARDRFIRKQNKRLNCMQSSLFFDINGLELSPAYAKVGCIDKIFKLTCGVFFMDD